jgi:DNA-binding response OmpR family regulator
MDRILIIEDDKVVSAIYRKKFTDAGFEVEVCHNGQDGYYRNQESRFVAVLLDLMLPEMGGLDVLRKIRAQRRFEHLPVFILTNAFFEDEATAAHEAGATQVFNKANTGPAALVEAVKTALHIRMVAPADVRVPVSAPTAPQMPSTPDVQESPVPPHVDPIADAEKTIKSAAALLPSLSRTTENSTRIALVIDILRAVHHCANIIAAADMHAVARVAFALEAFLNELEERPTHVNSSTLRSLAQTLDFITRCLLQRNLSERERPFSLNILVVDDDPISRRAVVKGLAKAGLKCVAVNTPDLAVSLLEENKFDLAVLDVDMPGTDGFELCRRIRLSPENNTVPVIFVTGLTDLQSRSTSILSGGSDYIAKPFLSIELGLKALMHVTGVQIGMS